MIIIVKNIWHGIQSVGPLKVLYTFPPLADLFIPAPTRLLWEAFSHTANSIIAGYSFIQLNGLTHCGLNKNVRASKQQRWGFDRTLLIESLAFYSYTELNALFLTAVIHILYTKANLCAYMCTCIVHNLITD